MVMERYVVHLTKKCNMACMYCYERDKTSTYSWEEIETLIRSIVANNNGNKYSVEFLGGEPCLEYEYIFKAVRLFNELDKEHVAYFIITTNGTIVNKYIIDFLLTNPNVIFSISLDGTKDANYLRIFKNNSNNTYDKIIFNMKMLKLANIPLVQLSVHMVTLPFNVKYLYDSVCHIYDLGIRNISIGTVESTVRITDSYEKTFVQQMKYVADDMANGEMNDLTIDLFHSFNPNQHDNRIYIKDDSGKTICETYGRANDDITNIDKYNVIETVSPLGDKIFNLRKEVYEYYWSVNNAESND